MLQKLNWKRHTRRSAWRCTQIKTRLLTLTKLSRRSMLRCRACLTQWSADSTTRLEMRTCFNKGSRMGARSGASTGSTTREVTFHALTMMTLDRLKTFSITCSMKKSSGEAKCTLNSNNPEKPEDSNKNRKISELCSDHSYPWFCSYSSFYCHRCYQEVSFRAVPTTATHSREPKNTTINLLLIE